MVDLHLEGETKESIICQLAEKIYLEGRIKDFDTYYQSVLERESLTSTGIGFGIAIPHGKTNAVKQCSVAFGRVDHSLDWESLDDEPVSMIFLLAVPDSCAGDEHLKIIAALSRKLIHEDFRELLKTSVDDQQIVSLINDSLQNIIS